MTDVSSSGNPLPKARPSMQRKRIAVRLPAFRAWPARPALPAYERAVVRWSMLMLGIGF